MSEVRRRRALPVTAIARRVLASYGPIIAFARELAGPPRDSGPCYTAQWYRLSSGGLLNAEQLRKARERGRLDGGFKTDGLWRYPLDAVC